MIMFVLKLKICILPQLKFLKIIGYKHEKISKFDFIKILNPMMAKISLKTSEDLEKK